MGMSTTRVDAEFRSIAISQGHAFLSTHHTTTFRGIVPSLYAVSVFFTIINGLTLSYKLREETEKGLGILVLVRYASTEFPICTIQFFLKSRCHWKEIFQKRKE